jgi:hypothetical protein
MAHNMRHRNMLRSQGREVLGDVTSFHQDRDGVYVHYAFQADGKIYRDSAELPEQMGKNIGEHMLLRYLPSDPSISHPSAWEWKQRGDIVPDILMLLFPLPGAAAAIALYRQRVLTRKGWIVEGKVTGCAPNGNRFTVYYEFRTLAGTLVEGSNAYSDECTCGSKILVIYLRHKPASNNPYPLGAYEVC